MPWTDHHYSRREIRAALAFWRETHSAGSRNRVRQAVAYVRQYRGRA